MKYWVVRKLANDDIRRTEVFAHNCGGGCCRSKKDFLMKLKWFVAIVAGKMLIIFPRSRWTKMDEAIDWVGLLRNIHGLLRSVYTLWFHHVTGRKVPEPIDAPPAGPAEFAALVDDGDVGIPDLEADGPDDADE